MPYRECGRFFEFVDVIVHPERYRNGKLYICHKRSISKLFPDDKIGQWKHERRPRYGRNQLPLRLEWPGNKALKGSSMTNALAIRAVRNNADWCDLVCRAHGNAGEFRRKIWINRKPVPRFYPNAQTLMASGAEMLESIDELARAGLPGGRAIKDSFASIDLVSRGFTPLFDAEWIALHPGHLKGEVRAASDIRWEVVREERALAEWERAWCIAQNDMATERVFRAPLLENRDVAFVTAFRGGKIVGGAIGNRSDGVIGWSNLFIAESRDLAEVAIGSIRMLWESFGDLPIVAYDGGEALQGALSIGFESLGPLRVWVRNP